MNSLGGSTPAHRRRHAVLHCESSKGGVGIMLVRIRRVSRVIGLATTVALICSVQPVSAQRSTAKGKASKASARSSGNAAKKSAKGKSKSTKAAAKPGAKSKSRKASAAKSTKGRSRQTTSARRLPKHFGQLALTDDQRDKVYAVQAKYLKQIAQLQDRIKTLRAKMSKDAEGVLTSAQKRSYSKLKKTPRVSSK